MEGVSEHTGAFQLTIDGREPSSIFQAFNESKVPSTRKNLDVGDFEIALDNNPCIIIERKTWGDLVSSLTSNRLAEQTARIVEKCKVYGARPVLIVEHDRVFGWDGTLILALNNHTTFATCPEGFLGVFFVLNSLIFFE
jgi:ERCC4-type nuclease